jgi:hypothetical protein
MHLLLLVKPNNLGQLEHLVDALNLVPVYISSEKASRMVLQLVIEVANREMGELLLHV